MKTVSIDVCNLCVPCRCFCRHCLLSSRGKASGVSYERGKRFAARMHEEMKTAFPDLPFYYYIGYCMDTPELFDYIRFCKERGYPSGAMLQMNGLRLRNREDTRSLLSSVHEAGVEMIDLTFYGSREYHDAFAGRVGDYDFLLLLAEEACRLGLAVRLDMPLLRSNLSMTSRVLYAWSRCQTENLYFFLPHSKGRGALMADQRITQKEFDGLSDEVKRHFSKTEHRTEKEWLRLGQFPAMEKRVLTLCLNPEEMDRFERMSAADMVSFLEDMDDQYQAKMPPLAELAARYGDPNNEQLFRLRDLALLWSQKFIREQKEPIWDMHDERHHFSVYL